MFRRLYAMNFFYRDSTPADGGGIADLTTAVKELKAEAQNGQAAVKKQIEGVTTDVKAVQDDIKVVKDEQDKIKDDVKAIKAKAGRQSAVPEGEAKSFKAALIEGFEANKEQIKAFAAGAEKSCVIKLDGKAVGDMTAPNNLTGGYPHEYASEIISLPSRKLHLRQLFGVGRTSERIYTFYEETGGEGGVASQNPEGATKSQVDFDLTQRDRPVATIAGFAVITRQLMNNLPGFLSFIQKRMPEKFYTEEDRQLLNGTGNNGELTGLLPAISAASTTDTNDLGALLDTIGEVEDTDNDVNGIVLRNSDYWRLLKVATLNKPDVIVIDPATGRMTIGGVPVFRSTAVPVDTAIVGDFNMGADILQLTNVNVALSYDDATNFRQNKVTVRVEAEEVFPIYRPNAFRKLDLGNVS
jgi:HK97 family phage major capsid protein